MFAIALEAALAIAPLLPIWLRVGEFIANGAVALGVFLEVYFGNITSKIQHLKLENALARLADAESKAAESNRLLEEERRERLKLEAEIAPRTVNEAAKQELLTTSRMMAVTRTVVVKSYATDVESAVLGKQIIEALLAASFNAVDQTTTKQSIGGFAVGVIISGSEAVLVQRLAHTFLTVGELAGAVSPTEPTGRMEMMSAPAIPNAGATILVGPKPPK